MKVRIGLRRHPNILIIATRMRNADITLASRSHVATSLAMAAMLDLWDFADANISQENLLPIGPDQVNELVVVENFCSYVPAQWLEIVGPDQVKLPEYYEHNGSTAKARGLAAHRQGKYRSQHNAGVTLPSRGSVTGSSLRIRRSKSPLPPASGGLLLPKAPRKSAEQRQIEQRQAREVEHMKRATNHAATIGCPLRPDPMDSPDSYATRVRGWELRQRDLPLGMQAPAKSTTTAE